MEKYVIYLPLLFSLIGLIFMLYKTSWVKKQDAGSDKMKKISKSIKQGALAFLNAEYKLLLVFVVIASVALYIISISFCLFEITLAFDFLINISAGLGLKL